jgi:hypothetical protein
MHQNAGKATWAQVVNPLNILLLCIAVGEFDLMLTETTSLYKLAVDLQGLNAVDTVTHTHVAHLSNVHRLRELMQGA